MRRSTALATTLPVGDAIAIVLVLPGELDVLVPDEPNRSAGQGNA